LPSLLAGTATDSFTVSTVLQLNFDSMNALINKAVTPLQAEHQSRD